MKPLHGRRSGLRYRPAFRRGAAAALAILAAAATAGCSPTTFANIELRGDDVILQVGNPSVTVFEFSDFECSFCRRFSLETFPAIRRDYVDAGKVRWVFRHVAAGGVSRKAAEAAECAGNQGKFWEYKQTLFQNQSALSVANLKQYAANLGLDAAAFDDCLDSGAEAAKVQADTDSARTLAIPGTPSFYVNGQLQPGFKTAAEFAAILDEALADAAK